MCDCNEGGREGGRDSRKERREKGGGGRVGNRFSHKRLVSHDLLLKSTPFPQLLAREGVYKTRYDSNHTEVMLSRGIYKTRRRAYNEKG